MQKQEKSFFRMIEFVLQVQLEQLKQVTAERKPLLQIVTMADSDFAKQEGEMAYEPST